jgi:AbrB family looped-hinge helix DNA binding protein
MAQNRKFADTRTTLFGTVTSQGQLTLPIALRRRLELHPGSKLLVEAIGGQLHLTPLTRPPIPAKKVMEAPADE